jgi:hypothetical protein
MTKERTLGVVLLAAVLPWVAFAQVKAGGEFQVNTYTTGRQYGPRAALDGHGFVVVWTSDGPDGSEYGVFGRRYDAAGTPLGGEFQVNSYTSGLQYVPVVAMDSHGRFTVVWASEFQDGSEKGIYAQRYDATGGALGGEFRVNSYTPGDQYYPAVADAGGTLVVVWGSEQDGGGNGVFGQRYGPGGTPLGGEFRINSYTTGRQGSPVVASNAAGDFVVIWESFGQDESTFGIYGQRYDATGTPLGDEFRVNSYTTDFQVTPAVAMDGGGRFVVAWRSDVQDAGGAGVFGQRYDASGGPLGPEFRVNTYTTRYQGRPDVAMDQAGNFVVVWVGENQDDGRGIFGQRYDTAGSPRGSEFRVNTYTTGYQGWAAIAMDAVGNFVVVWTSDGQDGSGFGIFGQRYGGLVPAELRVDASGNGVLEPGETVSVGPAWRNVSDAPLTFTGIASALAGPAGATYTLVDAAADYGTVIPGAADTCTDCYQVGVSRPATRPATHWDVTVRETIGPPALGQVKTWTLHVGESFADVPPADIFYPFIETLLHAGVTAGCTASTYCPDGSTTREQMAVFLLRAREGGAYTPPPCTTAPFPDVPCASPFAAWVQELVARGITAGCGGGLYCPTAPVTREQMAVFLLKTANGASFTPPPCAAASFADVPCSSPFAPWVQELVARAITAGCGGGLYCPTDPVTRGQMAVFLTKTFGLALYGP